MDRLGLGGGHPAHPVTSRDLAARGDRALALDADPQHLKSRECRLPPLLGGRTAQENSSTIIRAPACAIAAIPLIHAASSARNSRPMLTSPSGAIWIPAAEDCLDAGIASVSVSVPKASQGSGSTACKHRAIPDFPELEPPLRMIT
jgi:hypothetical protein